MSGNIVVFDDPRKLKLRLQRDQKGRPKYVLKALEAAAKRAQKYIQKKSPIDRGALRSAWKVIVKATNQVELVNDQPYAGAIENGTGPFSISREGREALEAWVTRKVQRGEMFLQDGQTAESVSWAIAKTFERVGIKGQKFVCEHFDQMVKMINAEMDKQMHEFHSRRLSAD